MSWCFKRAFYELLSILPSHHSKVNRFGAESFDVFFDSKLLQYARRIWRDLDTFFLSITIRRGCFGGTTCSDIGDLRRTFDNINSVAGPCKGDGNGKTSKAGTNNNDMLSFF